MVANIPPAFVLRSDQIVFHDDLPSTPQDSHEFCYDDHNFDHINYDDDYSENPYSTMNIHDIVRDHLYSLNYSLTGRFADRDTGSELPPLKLPNMNVVVDLMYERCRESVEERLMCRRYEAAHPSLFRWDVIDASEVDEESMYINQKQFQSNESAGESEEEKESGFESIGDLYLDTQIVDVLGRSRVLLAQFLSYYIDYVRELNGPKDSKNPINEGVNRRRVLDGDSRVFSGHAAVSHPLPGLLHEQTLRRHSATQPQRRATH